MLADLELLHDDPTPTRDWLQFGDEQNADIGAPPSGEKPM
jgi:hypothetical protein